MKKEINSQWQPPVATNLLTQAGPHWTVRAFVSHLNPFSEHSRMIPGFVLHKQ